MRAGEVAGSVSRRADATGCTITSSTSNSSASARTWSAASAGSPTTARRNPDSTTACSCGVSRFCLGVLDEVDRAERLAGAQPRHHLQVRQQQFHCLVMGFGHRRVDGQERDGFGGEVARPELRPVDGERLRGALPGEVVREHVRHPLGRGQMRRVHRRAEQPHPRFARRRGRRLEDVVLLRDRDTHAACAHHRDDVVEILAGTCRCPRRRGPRLAQQDTTSADRSRARGRCRGRCGRGAPPRAARTVRRPPAAHGWAA